MPITIAHPAAVLPLRHRNVPLSALVIGSLAPDFEYLLHLAPRSDFSHTALGLFTFCIPAGLVALWILHRIWKRPFLAVFAPGQEVKRFAFGPIPHFLMLCCEILIGALIHVIWDSFTHDYGWLVQQLEGLSRPIRIGGGIYMPLYVLLHHISSLLGCAALLYVAFHHRSWVWPAFMARWPLLLTIGWMTVAGGIALGMLAAGDVSNVEGLKRWVGCGLVVASVVLTTVITFFSLLWHLHHRHPGSVL